MGHYIIPDYNLGLAFGFCNVTCQFLTKKIGQGRNTLVIRKFCDIFGWINSKHSFASLSLKGLKKKTIIASQLDNKIIGRIFYKSLGYILGINTEMIGSSRHR